jgi:cation transport ATPase
MLLLGGVPLVWGLLEKLFAGTFGSDLLAGMAIVTSVLLGEYLAGVLVVLMLVGALPTWPHSSNWGYGPSGGLGLVVVILVVLLLMGRL